MDVFQEDLIDWFGEVVLSSPEHLESPMSPVSPLVPSSSPVSPESPLVLSSSPVSPKLPVTLKLPPSLPLLPPLSKPASSSALSLWVPVSPSAHPQSASSGHSDPPLDFQSPALLRHEDPLSPPPVSASWTPPRSFDPSAQPWLLAPLSPLCPLIPLAPLGSLVPPAPPWDGRVVDHPPPRVSTPQLRLVTLSLWLCLAPPSLRLHLLLLASPWLLPPSTPPWTLLGYLCFSPAPHPPPEPPLSLLS